MAHEKALAVPISLDEVVLCGDTTVALGRRILGKPRGREEAAAFLQMLSGRRHRVISAIALRHASTLLARDSQTYVRFKRLSKQEIEAYLDTGDWKGKAGGYAIQGPAASFIPWISGSYSGIVGLPLAEVYALLTSVGLRAFGK